MLNKLTFNTSERLQIIDITPKVRKLIAESKVKDGIAVVYSPHTSAAITINENTDPDLKGDIVGAMSRLFPVADVQYRHAGGNADAHIKTSLMGCSHSVIIEDRELVIGKWQSVYLFEADGPRERYVYVKIISG